MRATQASKQRHRLALCAGPPPACPAASSGGAPDRRSHGRQCGSVGPSRRPAAGSGLRAGSAEGTGDDVRYFIDVDELLDLWDELVLTSAVSRAWIDWFAGHRNINLQDCRARVRSDVRPGGSREICCGLYQLQRAICSAYSPGMAVDRILLGLLDEAPRHGYELKRLYDERFARDRPVNYGQIYRTLARLERDGFVAVAAIEAEEGPERKRYALTERGVTDLAQWLAEPVDPEPHLRTTLFARVVLALLTDRRADYVLDAQRARHLHRMRELTRVKREGDLTDRLLADYALFHIEADLRWMELTGARLADLGREL